MNKLVMCLCCFFGGMCFTFSQESEPKVLDQVFLQSGSELRGEIIKVNKKDGALTFVDLDGDTLNITRYDYKNYKENRLYLDTEDTLNVHPRPQDKFSFQLGFYGGGFSNQYNRDFLPLSIYAAFGRYFSNKTFVGLAGELGVLPMSVQTMYRPKLFVKQFYDPQKSNLGLYFIAEAGYSYWEGDLPTPYYKFYDQEVTLHAFSTQKADFASVYLGHGLSYIFKNGKSLGLELLVSRDFALNRDISKTNTSVNNTLDIESGLPDYLTYGLRIVLGL